MKIKILGMSLIILFSITILNPISFSVYGEIYRLEIDDTEYDIEYDFNGDVIAMDIDKETLSLLIATENVKDSEFQIKLPNELIHAENNEFAVLVNGFEVDYNVLEQDYSHLTFFIPSFTEEIEIIGTFVVPEFPFSALLVLGSIIGVIVLIQRSKDYFFS